jgi:F-type H+-transporting ATPase subunit a
MSAGQRGGIVCLVMAVAAAVFCGFVPFVFLPSIDSAMALPVIQLPGEILIKDVPFIENFTNTAVGILLADLAVIAVALTLRNPKMVPRGFQNLFEIIVEYLYNLTKQIAGARNGPKVFPLVATIFLLVLLANWIELIPGVDSVGLIHCAEEGKKGYPIQTDEDEAPFDEGLFGNPIVSLKVSENLDAGEIATEEDYHACEEKWFGHVEEGHAEEAEHEAEGEEVEGVTEEEDGAVEGEAGAEGEAIVEEDSEDEALAQDEEDHHANPDLLVVTPFVRAAATDLNMTLALALIAVVATQVWGVRELGIGYFAKFINLPALGKLGQKPMGIMDFAVGLLETISEFAKILSFGFRLFGNIFAGQVLLFVIPFLVATLLPGAIYGLELFVGLIQAFVFFMLTLVFIGMAMEGHHGDDDDHH